MHTLLSFAFELGHILHDIALMYLLYTQATKSACQRMRTGKEYFLTCKTSSSEN